MKKIVIVDGDDRDAKSVKEAVGNKYNVGTVSYFDIDNMALAPLIKVSNMVDSRDRYESGHSMHVAQISRELARNLGWSEKDCQNIFFIALLHDIGMICVPESIICKPERLDKSELSFIRQHTIKGSEIVRDIHMVENLMQGVMFHHERWDGSGYPHGLSGEDIPPVARVIALADAYDAMSSDRSYRPKKSNDKIISEFLRCRGTHFDPDMTDVFIFMLKSEPSFGTETEQKLQGSAPGTKEDDPGSAFIPQDTVSSHDDSKMAALHDMYARSYLNTSVTNRILEDRSGALMLVKLVRCDRPDAAIEKDEYAKVMNMFEKRIETLFRENDILTRIADDTFAIFVSGDSGKTVIKNKAGMIAGIIEREEFEKYRNLLSAATGIALCMEDGVTFEELYGAALAALDAGAD